MAYLRVADSIELHASRLFFGACGVMLARLNDRHGLRSGLIARRRQVATIPSAAAVVVQLGAFGSR
jgi:hypothetical protein